MQVRITTMYDVPEDDQSETSPTGLTEEAYEKLHDKLASMGMDDITIELYMA